MVTSAHVEASRAGCLILADGGTAIDAAIAVQAVLGTVEPFASGLGGGAVITYYDAKTKAVRTFDGLSASPSSTGGAATLYSAVAQDVSSVAPYNMCKSGLTVGNSISAQQGNTNISARAVAIPGALKVLDQVHHLYGKTAWRELWGEAIALAENGFPMTQYMYSTLYADTAQYDDDGNLMAAGTGVSAWVNSAGTVKGAARCKYPDIHRRYCDPGDGTKQKPLAVGTIIKNAELSATMKLVRDGGAEAFYDPNGPIAAAIVQRVTTGSLPCTSILPGSGTSDNPNIAATIASIPSLMTTADLGSYHAVERTPLVDTRFGMKIYTQPAPSFGGAVILYSLGLLERKNIDAQAFNSPGFVYLATEASRLANIDRRTVVGDPAFSNVNERVKALLGTANLDARAALINGTALGTVPVGNTGPAFAATDPAGYDAMASAPKGRQRLRHSSTVPMQASAGKHNEDWNTTSNLAIIDGYGNGLSMTTTINTHWGAHLEAGGMMMNNAMSNFSASVPGNDVNGYAASKRPRSSISPSIALDGAGRLRLVWGAAGGGPIPTTL